MNFTVTEAAHSQIKRALEEQGDPDLYLRVFVTSGGCSGFSYGMAFDRNQNPADNAIEQDGVRILVDPVSARHLEGVSLEYSGALLGGGFTIKNPNAVSTCGCGQSFQSRHTGAAAGASPSPAGSPAPSSCH